MGADKLKKRVFVVKGLLVGLFVLLTVLLMYWGSAGAETGPQVAGKPASFWLRRLPFEADQGFVGFDHPLEQAGPEIIPVLIEAIESGKDRHGMYRKVLRFVPPPLAKSLPEPDAPPHRMRTYSAFRLGQFGAAASNAVPSLERYYIDQTNGFGVDRVIQAIGSIGPASESALPTVIQAFGNPQIPSGWATTALLQIGRIPPEALPHLELDLQKQGFIAGPAAVALWIAKRDSNSIERVHLALESANVNFQAYTAVTLRFDKQLPSETKSKLRMLVESGQPSVRHGAAVALAYSGERSDKIIAALIEGLRGGGFATFCALALAEIGPSAKEAMPELKASFDTNSPALCRAFTKAMEAFSGVSRQQ
ncbi:MAG TPA: hypothetical protein VF773_22640 [Verrucomicrobiae bacterium]